MVPGANDSAGRLSERVRQPGLGGQAAGLEGADVVLITQRQADVVQPAQQVVFAEGLHVKGDFAAVGLNDALALQIDGEAVAKRSGQC